MIRVSKPAAGPFMLTDPSRPTRGPQLTAALIRRAEEGGTDFEFRSATYGAKSVKAALIAAQHGKCCFCESRVSSVAHGDVEHYRPKGGWDQEDGAGLRTPGYYWLAYDWANLYFACQICNQSFKRIAFPLADPATRAVDHRADLSVEDPLLLDPGAVDPEAFITWHGEIPVPRGGDRRGAATIRIVGLDRPVLNEVRLERLDDLRTMRDGAQVLADWAATGDLLPDEATVLERLRDRLAAAVRDDAVYAAMARAELGR